MHRLPLLLLVAAFTLPSSTEMSSAVTDDDAPSRHVALLFDDGPDFANSARLLAILEGAGVRASFAQIGVHVRAHPELTRAAAEAGHEIINHSMTHGRVGEMDDDALCREMLDPVPVFEAALGRAPSVYWPPFVVYQPRMDAVAAEGNMRILLPEGFRFVSSEDWNVDGTPREAIKTNALDGIAELAPGSADTCLILFHEWRDDTVAVLPEVIAELKAGGYRFITVSELLQLSKTNLP